MDGVVPDLAVRLAVALGIGLLIGVERERRMAERGQRGIGGVRTFALTGLLGGIVEQAGGDVVVAVALAFVGAGALLGYFREPSGRGLTTEIALVVTFLLGILAQQELAIASGFAVIVTILLATRTALHRFVSSVLTAQEMHDGLLLAAAALVVWPLLPDRTVGPFDVLNPSAVWRLVVLLMAISSAGYLAVRALGPRYGLPIAGLLGGFVSSTATIGAMGSRIRSQPEAMQGATSAALFSTVATIVQMAAVLGAVSVETLRELLWPLLLAGGGAMGVAGIATIGLRGAPAPERIEYGRAFDLRVALLIAGMISGVTLASAAAAELAGDGGVHVTALLGGFADTHAAAAGVAAIVAADRLPPSAAAFAVLGALSTNTVSKMLFAFVGGGRRFGLLVSAGLLIVLALAWAGVALPPM